MNVFIPFKGSSGRTYIHTLLHTRPSDCHSHNTLNYECSASDNTTGLSVCSVDGPV